MTEDTDWTAIKEMMRLKLLEMKMPRPYLNSLQYAKPEEKELQSFWLATINSDKDKNLPSFYSFVLDLQKKQEGGQKEEDKIAIARGESIEPLLNASGLPTGKYKIHITPIVDYLIGKYNFKTIYHTKHKDIFIYEDGVYTKNGLGKIETETEVILQKHCNNNIVREIVGKIERKTEISRDKFDDTPVNLIPLENGIYDIEKNVFIKFDPNYYFRTKLSVKYKPDMLCPKIDSLIEDTFYEDDIPFIYEWIGYNLYRKDIMKKLVILFGATDTAKTQILNLIVKMVGNNNISALSLQKLAEGKSFDMKSLYEKYSNIGDDLKSNDIATPSIKAATGGGALRAEHKFGDDFNFFPYSKHTFATNKIPSVKIEDMDDEAYYARVIPIACDNIIQKDEQIKDYINKIADEDELSGLLNKALKGLKKILKDGSFSFKKTPKQVRDIMERQNNPLSAFVKDVLIEKEGGRITKEDMYQLYTNYVISKGLSRLSKDMIGKRLLKNAIYIRDGRQSGRFWENVTINPNIYDTYDTLFKSYRVVFNTYNDYINMLLINSEKASMPSSKKDPTQLIEEGEAAEDTDTLDTFSEKDNEVLIKECMNNLLIQFNSNKVIDPYAFANDFSYDIELVKIAYNRLKEDYNTTKTNRS